MIARTSRLVLRQFELADLDALAQIFGDPRVMEFSVSGPMSPQRTRRWLTERARAAYERNGWGPWAMIHAEDGILIGFCGLLPQEIDGRSEAEVAYRLHPDYWGRGLATEAAIAVREHAFHTLGLERVISIIEPANVRSIRVAEKNGMQVERETVFWERRVRIYAVSRPPAGQGR